MREGGTDGSQPQPGAGMEEAGVVCPVVEHPVPMRQLAGGETGPQGGVTPRAVTLQAPVGAGLEQPREERQAPFLHERKQGIERRAADADDPQLRPRLGLDS